MKIPALQRTVLPALLLLIQAGTAGAAEPAGQPVKILCSFYPMYVMALNIVGDAPGVRVECMTEPMAGCLHDYQLTPGDLKSLGTADIFIANGAGMESFIEKAIRQSPRLRIIEASQGIPLVFPDNPHLWVSLAGAIEEVKTVARGLAAADPPRAAVYAENAAGYVARLEKLRRHMHAVLDGLPRRDIITFHEACPYFAREFNLKIVGVVEREPGSEPSAGELAQTIAMIRRAKVKALFAEPQYPARSAELIHRETGIRVRLLDPAVTGPREPAKARDAYLAAMENNLNVLAEALKE